MTRGGSGQRLATRQAFGVRLAPCGCPRNGDSNGTRITLAGTGAKQHRLERACGKGCQKERALMSATSTPVGTTAPAV